MSKKFFGLLFIVIVINTIFNGILQLHFDEAYYWSWSKNIDLSYYDHPPMVGYLIAISSLFGHSEFFVRLPGLFTATITILTLYSLAKKMFNQNIANITGILAITCPMIQATFFIITPDSPFIMFWALTLYAFYIGVFEKKTCYLYLSGIFAGCGLLSKYTAILIFPSLFLFLITSSRYRYILFCKDIYGATCLSFLVFLPVLIWNYQHDWISFIYQFRHGINEVSKFNWGAVGSYWGAHVLIGGPILFFAGLYYLIRNFKATLSDERLSYLFWTFIFSTLFFGYCGLFNFVQANWIAPVYLSSIIFVAYWLDKFNNKWVYRSSVVLIFIVLIVIKVPMLLIPADSHHKIPALDAFYGSKEKLEQVKPYLKNKDTILFACDYGNASKAWFYLGVDRVYVLDEFPFVNNYRYWNSTLDYPVKDAVYICDNRNQEFEQILHKYFTKVEFLKEAQFLSRIGNSSIYIYKLGN